MALATLFRMRVRGGEASQGAGEDVTVITINHRFRPESVAECEYVQNHFETTHGIKTVILNADWTDESFPKRNSDKQTAGRAKRYELLSNYVLDDAEKKKEMKEMMNSSPVLFTAHHQDDQAATFLLRLARGSGLEGLASIPSMGSHMVKREDGKESRLVTVARPLLGVRKRDLVEFCAEEGVVFVTDPSNFKGEYDRNRVNFALKSIEERQGFDDIVALCAGLASDVEELCGVIEERVKQSAHFYPNDSLPVYYQKLVEAGRYGKYLGSFSMRDIQSRIVFYRVVRSLCLKYGKSAYPPSLKALEMIYSSMKTSKVSLPRTYSGLLFQNDMKQGVIRIFFEASDKKKKKNK